MIIEILNYFIIYLLKIKPKDLEIFFDNVLKEFEKNNFGFFILALKILLTNKKK